MSKEYPYPCCRCGFCCLHEQCRSSLIVFGKIESVCPSLSWDGEKAVCNLPHFVNFGDGCCILARCYKDGRCYDFASLPETMKIGVAQSLKRKKEENYGRKS